MIQLNSYAPGAWLCCLVDHAASLASSPGRQRNCSTVWASTACWRQPIEHTRLSKRLPGAPWWHHPKAPHVLDCDLDLRNRLFGFGAGIRIDSPKALRDEHQLKLQAAFGGGSLKVQSMAPSRAFSAATIAG